MGKLLVIGRGRCSLCPSRCASIGADHQAPGKPDKTRSIPSKWRYICRSSPHEAGGDTRNTVEVVTDGCTADR